MLTIKTLRALLNDGERDFPIFLGYLSARELIKVAAVPSFTPESAHYEIASNVLGDPVVDWQRPPIESKVGAIRERFSRNAELMPNPILLAVNNAALVEVRQQVVNGQHTEIYEIDIAESEGDGARPFWILDGQHRVLGLAESARGGNPVPLVLLHSDVPNGYAPRQFAKIFAEVTTLATPLHSLHGDWLQFAFHLGAYNSPATPDWKAMRAVAELCRAQQFGAEGAVTNPFFDKIAFNPEKAARPAIEKGFEFTSSELKELVRDNYYALPSATTSLLPPEELGEQLARAVLALAAVHTTTTERSALFGDVKARQKYMEEGFIVGVLSSLRAHGVPTSWQGVLKSLGFSGANWDFTGWVVTTGGNAGTLSKRVARVVFQEVFGAGALPEGVPDIPTYLRGDAAQLVFRSSELTPSGRAKKHGYVDHVLPVSGIKKLDMGPRRHLKLISLTSNVGQLEVRDVGDILATKYSASALRKGVVMPEGGGRVELAVGASLYGGTKPPTLTLEVAWE